jgi:hypothetical protein
MPPACWALESAPAACVHAWGSSLITASRFSLAPLGEPGSVMTSDLFLVPATGRAIIATGRVSSDIYGQGLKGRTWCDTQRGGNHAVPEFILAHVT